MGLLELNPYLDSLLALALGFLIIGIMRAVAAPLRGLPAPLNQLANLVDGIAQAISNACGKILSPLSSAVGASLHSVARVWDHIGNTIVGHARVIEEIATELANVTIAFGALRAVAKHLGSVLGTFEHPLRALQSAVHGIDRELKALEKDFSHGIGNDVLPQIKHLRKELNVFERSTATDIADAEAQAEAATADLWTWITGIGSKPLKLKFSGAIAVALGAIGLGGLNCLSFSKFLNKWSCGLGPLLDALLGLVVSSIVLEETCVLLPFLESAFGDVVGPITHLLTEVPLGGCETPPTGWASLSVKMGPVPPPQTLGSLPV